MRTRAPSLEIRTPSILPGAVQLPCEHRTLRWLPAAGLLLFGAPQSAQPRKLRTRVPRVRKTRERSNARPPVRKSASDERASHDGSASSPAHERQPGQLLPRKATWLDKQNPPLIVGLRASRRTSQQCRGGEGCGLRSCSSSCATGIRALPKAGRRRTGFVQALEPRVRRDVLRQARIRSRSGESGPALEIRGFRRSAQTSTRSRLDAARLGHGFGQSEEAAGRAIQRAPGFGRIEENRASGEARSNATRSSCAHVPGAVVNRTSSKPLASRSARRLLTYVTPRSRSRRAQR